MPDGMFTYPVVARSGKPSPIASLIMCNETNIFCISFIPSVKYKQEV